MRLVFFLLLPLLFNGCSNDKEKTNTNTRNMLKMVCDDLFVCPYLRARFLESLHVTSANIESGLLLVAGNKNGSKAERAEAKPNNPCIPLGISCTASTRESKAVKPARQALTDWRRLGRSVWNEFFEKRKCSRQKTAPNK